MNNPITSQDWQDLFQSQKIIGQRIAELQKSQAETAEQIRKTEAQMDRTDIRIEKVFKMFGGHLNNVGDVTEEFFYRGLSDKKRLGNVTYDIVRRKIESKDREYDIIMVNGDSVAVISVKYKLYFKDIDNFLKGEVKDFKKCFPEFKNYKVYAGIASKFMNQDLQAKITKAGLFAISQSGKEMQVLNEGRFQAKVF